MRKFARNVKGLLLLLLTALSFTLELPVNPAEAAKGPPPSPPSTVIGSQDPRYVGANSVPDLSLPHTVLSNIDSLINSGGVMQASPDNLTIYNLALAMRLRGGLLPHDELLGPGHRVLSMYSFWGVEANITGHWTLLIPVSNNFTIIGTNTTGTYVARTMRVAASPYSGQFKIVYKATSGGPLKYDLLFTPALSGQYRLTYIWANTTSLQNLSSMPRHFQVSYGTANYTLSWDDVPVSMNATANLAPGVFTLHIELGLLVGGLQVGVDPSIVSDWTQSRSTSTSFTFQRKVFYEPVGGYHFLFYYNGYSTVYAYTQNGTIWIRNQPMPPGWPAYNDTASSSPFVLNSGRTVIVAAGQTRQPSFTCTLTPCSNPARASLYFVQGNISGYTIAWGNVQSYPIYRYCSSSTTSCTISLGIRYVSLTLASNGSLGIPVFSFNFFANGPVTTGEGDGYCHPDWDKESDVVVLYQAGGVGFADCENDTLDLRTTVLAADSQGGIRVVYQYHSGSLTQLRTRVFGGTRVVRGPAAATADTYIQSYWTTNNNGAVNPLHLASPQVGCVCEADALVEFSPAVLNAVPPGALVTSANLTFTPFYGSGQGNDTIYVGEANSPWAENTATWNNKPGVLLQSLSRVGNQSSVYLANGKPFTLDVTRAVGGVVQGGWFDNGFFVGLGLTVTRTYVPSLDVDSRESANATSPTLTLSYLCCRGNYQILEPNEDSGGQFSAVVDANYGSHVVFQNGTDGNVTYAYRGAGSSYWTNTTNIFYQCATGLLARCLDSDPTITLDYSTGDLYAFAIITPPPGSSQAPSVMMKHKSLAQNWHDVTGVTVAANQYPIDLGSNIVSVSGTNSSWLSLVWTNAIPTSPPLFNVMFESIPIQTVWSPFASPSDPWDGYGLAPYGEYFGSLGEYVSASTGLLTVRQTDLSLPGRGLGLEITRVYTEPYSFLGGVPSNFEPYDWASLGYGWQLSFPWMTAKAFPRYIHLWDGQGYSIPSSFWNSTTGFLENHQGEHFRLTRNSTDVVLYAKTGVYYRFDPSSHALTKIADPLGNNITFAYAGVGIASITDTIGRTFLFCYNGSALRIDQASGSCSKETGRVRSVSYVKNASWSLINATDPAGRSTNYQYSGTTDSSVAPWLLSGVTYPTGWYTTYVYAPRLIGTDSQTYRVTAQTTYTSSGSTVKQFQYSFTNAPGGQVFGSTVQAYNGTQIRGYTDYSFSFAGMYQNISDASHRLARGVHELFGAKGEVVKETIIVADSSTPPKLGTYTNYYRYDLWGNLIYSRKAINATTNAFHDNYYAYYNNGLPPKFNDFQETFSQSQGTATDNPWNLQTGNWNVKNGLFNGTQNGGQQESIFAWSDIGKQDVSIQARVYVTRRVNNTAGQLHRFGVLAHYPGNGTYKWALIIHTTSSGSSYLEFLDEWGYQWGSGFLGDSQPSAKTSCSITPSVWYTFNMTVHGYTATGWAQADGQPLCGQISGTFSNLSRAASGTGFGLYAGGYSTLFDNVTLGDSNTSSLSNSFIANGGPGPNAHASLAGTGELQQPSGLAGPVENYYSYYYWGGLYQTRQRYGSQWLSATLTYDGYGNPSSRTDATGNVTYFQYSPAYKYAYLTNQTSRDSGIQFTTLYAYDFNTGGLLNSTDPRGSTVSYQYDILGRLTRMTYPNGLGFASYMYSDGGNYVNATNENNWKNRQAYDGLGRLVRAESFSGGVSYSNKSMIYDWRNVVTQKTDPLGNVYRYTYDALGRILATTKPDGTIVSQTYNDTASWVLATDEDGNNRCSIYDRLGRLVSVIEKSTSTCKTGIVTNYWYDETGNLLRVTSSNLQTTQYQYDNLNQLTMATYPDNTVESYVYSKNGEVVSRADRNMVTTLYSYDSLNRLRTVTYCGTSTTSDGYTYDKNGNLAMLQSQNATLSYTYDARNRMLNEAYSVNGGNSAANLTCPVSGGGGGGDGSVAEGTLITLADGTSMPVQNLSVGAELLAYNVTTDSHTRDPITQLTVVYTSNMLIIDTEEPMPLRVDNATAQKLWVKKADGAIGWFPVTQVRVGDSLFDALAQHWTRVTRISFAPTGTHKMYDIFTTAPYNYVANGYLDPVKKPVPASPAPAGSLGPDTSPAASYRVGYSYIGETISGIAYPDGFVANYTYDGLGRVATVFKLGGSTYATTNYYKDGYVSSILFGNSLNQTYSYDVDRRPSQIKLVNGTATPLLLNYNYNKTGTVASVTGNTVSTSGLTLTVSEQYKYDALHRLTNSSVKTGGTTTSLWYEYDNLGNRKRQNSNSILTTYSYTLSNNELASSTSLGLTNSYGYDSNGNTIQKYAYVGSTLTLSYYTYDVSNHLGKVTGNGGTGSYAYDGLGRRVESVESSTTLSAYLGTDTLYEQVQGGSSTDYVYADGMRIARVSTGTVSYYHTDLLGSTRLVTSSTRTVLFSDSYQPFGQDNGTPSGSETYKFTGKPVSATTGLYYYYQRWYDPSIGRFISQDSYPGQLSDPQSLNPYAYVENGPTSNTDPTGQFLIEALIGAGVGAGVGYFGCAIFTGGWTSSACGEAAAIGAGIGGLAGLTDGLSLFGGVGLCEEDEEACTPPPNPVSPSNTDATSPPVTPSTTVTVTTDSNPGVIVPTSTDVSFEDSFTIRFSQNSVSPYFRNGGSIQDLAEGLRNGEVNPADVPPIRVVSYNDNLYTLDNRRLVAFQQAGVDVPVVRVPLSGSIAQEFARKFTTTPELGMGLRIIIRGIGIWPP